MKNSLHKKVISTTSYEVGITSRPLAVVLAQIGLLNVPMQQLYDTYVNPNIPPNPNQLSRDDIDLTNPGLNILICGAGANSHAYYRDTCKASVVSMDPFYNERNPEVMKAHFEKQWNLVQTRLSQRDDHCDEYSHNLSHELNARKKAEQAFSEDFKNHPEEYINGKLPELTTQLKERTFNVVIVQNCLILYGPKSGFDLDFTIQSLENLLKIANRVIVYPLYDLFEHQRSEMADQIATHFIKNKISVKIKDGPFQQYVDKSASERMILTNQNVRAIN